MQFYSTKNKNNISSLKEAVLSGMPLDNGLYMPLYIPQVDENILNNFLNLSFQEISFEIAKLFFTEKDISHNILKNIVYDTINFDAPLIKVLDDLFILELFHGPTLAFKDFGARFMSRIMSHFVQDTTKKLNILVATSGDTGSAVANGFYKVEGIDVIILYPSGKISKMQEQQISTLGENIIALKIEGTFDDCQKLVKKAFLDQDLCNKVNLSSANSINVARLIPQSFYYFWAYQQYKKLYPKKDIIISVPSGNFGNLTAGLIAKKMGLPVKKFIASTNINSVVPEYINTGEFIPRSSVETISNAMDVGNPSNFARMIDLYNNNLDLLKQDIAGYYYSDEKTRQNISDVYLKSKYILEPHASVALLGLKEYLEQNRLNGGIFLGTAHPAKFVNVVEAQIKDSVIIPDKLKDCSSKQINSISFSSEYNDLKSFLLKRR